MHLWGDLRGALGGLAQVRVLLVQLGVHAALLLLLLLGQRVLDARLRALLLLLLLLLVLLLLLLLVLLVLQAHPHTRQAWPTAMPEPKRARMYPLSGGLLEALTR